jgi:hypothetical protein
MDFDVAQMGPATVRLVYDEQEVATLRSAYEDVATPYEPFQDKPLDACACLALGADGYMNLTFKFDSPAIAAILGDVADGVVLKLTLVGELREEFGARNGPRRCVGLEQQGRMPALAGPRACR